jgi:hypothetical protein
LAVMTTAAIAVVVVIILGFAGVVVGSYAS